MSGGGESRGGRKGGDCQRKRPFHARNATMFSIMNANSGATVRATKTFSLDKEVLAEVKRTRGSLSESERVNRLLRFALDLERRAALEQEVADFFAEAPADRADRRAFQSASLKSWARDGCR